MKLAYIRTNHGALHDYTAVKEDGENEGEEIEQVGGADSTAYLEHLAGDLGENDESDEEY